METAIVKGLQVIIAVLRDDRGSTSCYFFIKLHNCGVR